MKYDGLIGKIGNAIPNTSTAKFAGIGAAVVAPIGAGLSYYENQDWGDAAAGALRSAAFGGMLGVAAHKLPGIIANNTTGKGVIPITEEVLPTIGKSLTENLGPVRNAFKEDINYLTTPEGQLATARGFLNFRNSEGIKFVQEAAQTNNEIFQSMSKIQVAKTMTSQMVSQGFKSAYHHIVQPTGQFFKGNFNFETVAATAFSGYGIYEAGSAINNVRQGNYSEASKNLGMLAIGKLNYAGVASLVKTHNALTKQGISYTDLYNGYKAVKQNPQFAMLAATDPSSLLAGSYIASAQAKNLRQAVKTGI